MSSIATMFYERDLNMNLDQKNQIKQSLEKLGYINTDHELREQNFIKDRLIYKLSVNKLDTQLSIDDLTNQIKKDTDYLSYCKYLNYCKKRGIELEKYLESNDSKDFYNSCTDGELEYLGY